MPDTSTRSPHFWETVSEDITAKVEEVRHRKGDGRASLLVYLRDLEVVARQECRCRDTIQIIASGRHLLGDSDDVPPAEAAPPLSRSRRASGGGNGSRESNLHE